MVKLGNSWDQLLEDQWSLPYYRELREKLIQEYKTQRVYPDMYDIFQALQLTDYKDVKVVILGQDPYHGPGQAHGLSFSVQKGIPLPPSLRNIYEELRREVGFIPPDHGDLTTWAKKGVLLLNASLTVRQGEPNSHAFLGWEKLTDRMIELINEKEDPVVFLLWGAYAQKKAKNVDEKKHLVLKTSHPSPLSVYRGFEGCGHFKKTVEFIKEKYGEDFSWDL